MYINSPGISAPDGRAIGFDTEAFAIADVMQYIRAPVATVCVGQCYGSAAMLLAWCVACPVPLRHAYRECMVPLFFLSSPQLI